MSRSFLAVIVLLLVALALSLALVQASPAETVQAARDGDRITLSNDAIAATWSVRGASLQWQALANRLTGAPVDEELRAFA